MRILISIVLIIFGISAIIGSGVELFSGDEEPGVVARICYILSGVIGAGLAFSGPGVGKRFPWARFLAYGNLVGMFALSVFSVWYTMGHISSTQHLTRALLAAALFAAILRLPEARGRKGRKAVP